MNNAPGQLLGFSIQFPRALWYLLTCGIEDKISVEVHGDVGLIRENGTILSEEDKSSQNSNPVTDRSSDLWKTFYNWTNAVVDGELEVDNTAFHLYTNKKGRKGIVDTFHTATNIDLSLVAISAAWKKLDRISEAHEIYPYIQYLKSKENIFSKIISKFEFCVGSETGLKEVCEAIRKKHVSEFQVDYLQYSLLGWIQNIIISRLAEKKNAIITWKEFDFFAKPILEKAWKRELIDFTLQYPLDQTEVKEHTLQRPPYIKQLEAIKSDDDDIQEAVTAYLKAKVNRQKWIEQELLDEDSAKDFEDKLISFWKTQKKTIDITYANYQDEERGQLIYNNCIAKSQLIKNQDPPSATVAGTYHLLANSLTMGWHPKWKETFITPKD